MKEGCRKEGAQVIKLYKTLRSRSVVLEDCDEIGHAFPFGK